MFDLVVVEKGIYSNLSYLNQIAALVPCFELEEMNFENKEKADLIIIGDCESSGYIPARAVLMTVRIFKGKVILTIVNKAKRKHFDEEEIFGSCCSNR